VLLSFEESVEGLEEVVEEEFFEKRMDRERGGT
jgi:hypothetical protein